VEKATANEHQYFTVIQISWCSLFIIPVFHEEDYLCGTYRYVVLEHVGGAWLYELESCSEKRNFSFICARGMVLDKSGCVDVKFSAINQIIHVAEESLGSAAFKNTAVIKWNPFSNKRKEISALSVLEVWFVLFILYTEYVALHSSFRGKSSVFTKWHVVHLQ
jgi:hypothetical protein